jgi:EAL and modified HD-GYP domain-containing signal transduction protein
MPINVSAPAATRTFVARQPIFDRERRVVAYDLPVRASTASALVEALAGPGFEALAGGRRAFVALDAALVDSDVLARLPKDRVVFELTSAATANESALARCRELVTRGFAVAVDGAALNGDADPLAALASHLVIDFTRVDTPEQRAQIAQRRPPGAQLVARHVDTMPAFIAASAEGFAWIEGRFLAHPTLTPGKPVDVGALGRMRVLHALHNPMLSVAQIEELIKPDTTLCYQVLRTVNSAAFAQRRTIQSIHDALLLLGRDMVRRWISVWTVAGLGRAVHPELMTMSAVRARTCELVGDAAGGPSFASEGFLGGLCSSLDAILGVPMEEVVQAVPLTEDAKAALLGADNRLRVLLGGIKAYERGQWATAGDAMSRLGVPEHECAAAYLSALKWARELQRA